jgi:SsrA-binding protein
MAAKPKKSTDNTIARNKKAGHDYFLEEKIEAGLELTGWEVKSCRAGKVQLTDTYVFFKNGEAFLLGAQITPLNTASSHLNTDPGRTRKLLLNRKEIDKMRGAVEAKGYSVLCTALYWKNHLVKAQVALGKGKAQHDKRDAKKDQDWQRQKQRMMRSNLKTG